MFSLPKLSQVQAATLQYSHWTDYLSLNSEQINQSRSRIEQLNNNVEDN